MLKTFWSLALLMPAIALASTPCIRDSTGAIDAAVNVGCGTTPQAYDVTIYKLGLCTANPALAATPDFSSCTMLIDGGGQLAHLAAGSSIVLSNVATPPLGTYGHAVMVASNSIGITNTQRYSLPMTGAAGGVGTTCWSVAGIVKQESPAPSLVACGATASPGVTIDKLDHFNNGGPGDPSVGGAFNGRSSNVSVIGGVMFAKLARSDLNAATGADFPDGITRLIAVESFTTPVKVISTSTRLDIGFDVSDSSAPWVVGNGPLRQYGTGPFSMVITVR